MRKLIITEFITLDGVIQAPGGADEDTEGGFAHGGWTLPYWHDSIGEHFMELLGGADTMLLGRKTWEIHGTAFEPMGEEGDEPFFTMLNRARKVVVSRSLPSADLWRNSTIVRENVVQAVRALKAEPGKDILMDGSSEIAHIVLSNGLVDELALHVYPLALGNGKRLFPEGSRSEWRLVHSEALPTGVVYQRLEPA